MPDDPNRAAMQGAFDTGEDRIGWLLDGVVKPVAPPPAPSTTIAGTYVERPAGAPAATEESGPGFWSKFGGVASSIGGSLFDAGTKVAVAAAGRPRGTPPAPAIASVPPPRPKWLPWAIGGGVLLVILVILGRR